MNPETLREAIAEAVSPMVDFTCHNCGLTQPLPSEDVWVPIDEARGDLWYLPCAECRHLSRVIVSPAALRAWARLMIGREVEPPTSMHGSKILPSRPWPDPPPPMLREPEKPHDCAPCAHWERRMREQHMGDCEALGMPTLAAGGGCLRHFTPRGEGVNKWME